MKINYVLFVLISTALMTTAHAQSTAEKIAAIPCSAITTNVISNMGGSKYRKNEAWGIPYAEWDTFAFNNLKKRSRDCNVKAESGMMDIPSLIQFIQNDMVPQVEVYRAKIDQQAENKKIILRKIDESSSIKSSGDGIKFLESLKRSSEYISLGTNDREFGSNDREQINVALNRKLELLQEAEARERSLAERDRKRQIAEQQDRETQAREAEVLRRSRAERERKVQAAEREAREAQQAAENAEAEIKERQAAAASAEENTRRREANQAAIMKEEEEANARIAAALAQKQQAAERAARANATNADSLKKEQVAKNKENVMVVEEQKAEQSLQKMKEELSEKQECSIARKVVEIEQPNLAGNFSKLAVEFQAGMKAEGCTHLISAFNSAEKMRKSIASCEPSAAIEINKVVEGMRSASIEQGCGRLP